LLQDGEALLSRAMADKGFGRDVKSRPNKGDRPESVAGVRPLPFKAETRQRSSGKAAKTSKSLDKGSASQKKAPRKRR
jgi:hypothetical protein